MEDSGKQVLCLFVHHYIISSYNCLERRLITIFESVNIVDKIEFHWATEWGMLLTIEWETTTETKPNSSGYSGYRKQFGRQRLTGADLSDKTTRSRFSEKNPTEKLVGEWAGIVGIY